MNPPKKNKQTNQQTNNSILKSFQQSGNKERLHKILSFELALGVVTRDDTVEMQHLCDTSPWEKIYPSKSKSTWLQPLWSSTVGRNTLPPQYG